jgi:hypothetical protein
MRFLPAFIVFLVSVSCREPSVDLSGEWAGNARINVDGEQKEAALRLDLEQSEEALGGTILWNDYSRQITAASFEGPEVRIESSVPTDVITFVGLFKDGTIEGRFSVKYDVDPEPFTGRFSVKRAE